MDLKFDRKLLDTLIPALSSPQFEKALASATPNASKSERFLMKMELKRLAKPCLRTLDLRGSVDGKCQPFEFRGKTHYLDGLALEEFKKQVALYGHFAEGVYEAIQSLPNNYRIIHQQQAAARQESNPASEAEPSPPERYQTQVIRYRGFYKRQEERMNFVAALEIFGENGEHFYANSIDISVSGLQIKTEANQKLSLDQTLTIFFRGLEQDYVLDKAGVPYKVVHIRYRSDQAYLCLARINSDKTPKFDEFLHSFIHGNKRRYKVNLDNTLEAVRAKCYEQYLVSTFNYLPIFVEQQGNQYAARYTLLNDNNQALYDEWQHGPHHDLGYLLNPRRLKQWCDSGQDSLIYLITGWNDTENIPDVQIYNPENDEWMMGTSVPDTDNYKSFGASGMIVDNTIYYFGGARSSGSFGIQNNLRMGTINPDNPSEIEWSVMTPSAFVTGYRMAATAIDDELHWIGGSNKTYNYDGIAYDGSGPVSPSNRNIFLSTSEFVWKQNGPFALPMDLRGIANVEKRVKYIAGGMMAGQEVTNKVFKLEWEGPTNTMENISSIALKIGPNPVEDILMVDSEAPQYKIEKIEIWDAMSKKHSILHFHQSEVQISLAHLPKGIYILHITVAGKIHTHQVVKI